MTTQANGPHISHRTWDKLPSASCFDSGPSFFSSLFGDAITSLRLCPCPYYFHSSAIPIRSALQNHRSCSGNLSLSLLLCNSITTLHICLRNPMHPNNAISFFADSIQSILEQPFSSFQYGNSSSSLALLSTFHFSTYCLFMHLFMLIPSSFWFSIDFGELVS
jgi:hypothetical protein